MSNEKLFYVFLAIFIGFLISMTFSFVYADMQVELKDGRMISVPVNKDDIIRISFEDTSRATGRITWDFETGDLRGWVKTGDAFNFQPTYGDNPTARNRGQASKHQGQYWIGGYEKRMRASDPAGQVQGDGPQGTLTSDTFTISRPSMNFLLGGGCDINAERVELLIDGQVVFKATGKCTETMERMSWDVSQYQGRSAEVRLIDASGGGWGHINFDDVRFE
ncbi:MAG: hypothetical protein NT047_05785 [Deltaproteobacteria bacterium]|nr:hypothetical protein [Deltaproteobacteria bacterium]